MRTTLRLPLLLACFLFALTARAAAMDHSPADAGVLKQAVATNVPTAPAANPADQPDGAKAIASIGQASSSAAPTVAPEPALPPIPPGSMAIAQGLLALLGFAIWEAWLGATKRVPPNSTLALVMWIIQQLAAAVARLARGGSEPPGATGAGGADGAPGAAGAPGAGKASSASLVVIALLALAAPACSSAQLPMALQRAERDALGCAVPAAQAELQAVSPAVMNALAGNDAHWEQQLTALEANAGAAVSCTVAHLVWDALGGGLDTPPVAKLLRIADERTQFAEAGEQVPDLPPARQVVRRGARWLSLRLAAHRAKGAAS